MRSPRTRGSIVGLAASVAVLLALAGSAFACSPTCCFASLYQTAGAPNSQVTVHGNEFGTNNTAVIRWASATGPILGTATGNEWTKTITIPDVAPGFYSVVVQSSEATPLLVGGVSPTLRVTDATPATPVTTPPADPTAGQPTASPAPPPASSGPAATTSPAAQPTTATDAQTGVPSSSTVPVAATGRSLAATPAPERGFVHPLNPVVGPVPPGGTVALPAVVPSTSGPASLLSADTPALVASNAGALPLPWRSRRSTPAVGLLDAAQHHGRPLGWGVAILGLGLVGLFGAAAVLGLRKPAPVEDQPHAH